jgi:hypothetical protein
MRKVESPAKEEDFWIHPVYYRLAISVYAKPVESGCGAVSSDAECEGVVKSYKLIGIWVDRGYMRMSNGIDI